jgi:hypothetical protein
VRCAYICTGRPRRRPPNAIHTRTAYAHAVTRPHSQTALKKKMKKKRKRKPAEPRTAGLEASTLKSAGRLLAAKRSDGCGIQCANAVPPYIRMYTVVVFFFSFFSPTHMKTERYVHREVLDSGGSGRSRTNCGRRLAPYIHTSCAVRSRARWVHFFLRHSMHIEENFHLQPAARDEGLLVFSHLRTCVVLLTRLLESATGIHELAVAAAARACQMCLCSAS